LHPFFKYILLAIDAAVLSFLFMKVILPLALMHLFGHGVNVSLPLSLARGRPRLTILAFSLVGPLLFFALLIAGIFLLRR
jgi:hypothetical protein